MKNELKKDKNLIDLENTLITELAKKYNISQVDGIAQKVLQLTVQAEVKLLVRVTQHLEKIQEDSKTAIFKGKYIDKEKVLETCQDYLSARIKNSFDFKLTDLYETRKQATNQAFLQVTNAKKNFPDYNFSIYSSSETQSLVNDVTKLHNETPAPSYYEKYQSLTKRLTSLTTSS